ncbi:uncharacterized protein LOC113359770 [Papaver somniferum]|uniref:uncharacterized protein LOC113359770 n=1 Tax=Papaver somniferum TaxID=3469 RepID=UPI000E6F885A|nr:uncharacterized protein LOC113359770 [Papaver somniferum]
MEGYKKEVENEKNNIVEFCENPVLINFYHAIDHVDKQPVQLSQQLVGNLLQNFKVLKEQFMIAKRNLEFVRIKMKEANEELGYVSKKRTSFEVFKSWITTITVVSGIEMSTSSVDNYDYYYSSSFSSSSDEDSKASVAKSKAKTTHDEGAKSSVPLNDRRVTYTKLMKRNAEDDEAENRQRRRDRIRRRVQAAEERRQFLDGVPSDSDADVSEEETAWVFTERKIKPNRYEREFRRTMKQIEAEAEAEEDSDSDDDPEARPDFIPDADSDEEEDSDDKYDDSDDEKDSDDESDNSDESDE